MRRTKVQREWHRREVDEALVKGDAPRQVVRAMVRKFQLTPRQARHDVKQVLDDWQREDDRMRQGKRKERDLAIAADRREHEWRSALEANDPRRAARTEKDRCKLLGLYAAERQRPPYVPQNERQKTVDELRTQMDALYAAAPRNADGSVVLTALSRTRPPVEQPAYQRAIEHPGDRRLSDRRQERIDTLRAKLAEGTRFDQLEQTAREQFQLSQRTAREDVLILIEQLEEEGERLRHGTHALQLLPLAVRRRERLCQMAREQEDHALATDLDKDRALLLGLYACDRRRDAGPTDTTATQAERTIEVELSRRDRLRGHLHTVGELLPSTNGPPSGPHRQPWTPPRNEMEEPDSHHPGRDRWATDEDFLDDADDERGDEPP